MAAGFGIFSLVPVKARRTMIHYISPSGHRRVVRLAVVYSGIGCKNVRSLSPPPPPRIRVPCIIVTAFQYNPEYEQVTGDEGQPEYVCVLVVGPGDRLVGRARGSNMKLAKQRACVELLVVRRATLRVFRCVFVYCSMYCMYVCVLFCFLLAFWSG